MRKSEVSVGDFVIAIRDLQFQSDWVHEDYDYYRSTKPGYDIPEGTILECVSNFSPRTGGDAHYVVFNNKDQKIKLLSHKWVALHAPSERTLDTVIDETYNVILSKRHELELLEKRAELLNERKRRLLEANGDHYLAVATIIGEFFYAQSAHWDSQNCGSPFTPEKLKEILDTMGIEHKIGG